MFETMTIDSRTVIIKSDNEEDLPAIIDTINKKDKLDTITSFLKFAAENRITKSDYRFNREECYGR